jgi:hypothetical protein
MTALEIVALYYDAWRVKHDQSAPPLPKAYKRDSMTTSQTGKGSSQRISGFCCLN